MGKTRVMSSVLDNPEQKLDDFMKNDLKDVLDLSKCSLRDENVLSYLKEARGKRKIKGLKLANNELTDKCFD